MHQSAHHVLAYGAPSPALGCARDLQLMAGAATYLHGRCIEAMVGEWQAVTFVPSTTRPGVNPTVAGIVRRVHSVYPACARLGSWSGVARTPPQSSVPRADRFLVPDEYRSQVVGLHVLVAEDTWATGAKAQSAALALKAAGAS